MEWKLVSFMWLLAVTVNVHVHITNVHAKTDPALKVQALINTNPVFMNWTLNQTLCPQGSQIRIRKNVGGYDEQVAGPFPCLEHVDMKPGIREYKNVNVSIKPVHSASSDSVVSLMFTKGVNVNDSGKYALEVFGHHEQNIELVVLQSDVLTPKYVTLNNEDIQLGASGKFLSDEDKKILEVELHPSGPEYAQIRLVAKPSEEKIEMRQCRKSTKCMISLLPRSNQEKVTVYLEYPQVQGSEAVIIVEISIPVNPGTNIAGDTDTAGIIGGVLTIVVILALIITGVLVWRFYWTRAKPRKRTTSADVHTGSDARVGIINEVDDRRSDDDDPVKIKVKARAIIQVAEKELNKEEPKTKSVDAYKDLQTVKKLKKQINKSIEQLERLQSNVITNSEQDAMVSTNTGDIEAGDEQLEALDPVGSDNQRIEEAEVEEIDRSDEEAVLLAALCPLPVRLESREKLLDEEMVRLSAEEEFYHLVILTPPHNTGNAQDLVEKIPGIIAEDKGESVKMKLLTNVMDSKLPSETEAVQEALNNTPILIYVIPEDHEMEYCNDDQADKSLAYYYWARDRTIVGNKLRMVPLCKEGTLKAVKQNLSRKSSVTSMHFWEYNPSDLSELADKLWEKLINKSEFESRKDTIMEELKTSRKPKPKEGDVTCTAIQLENEVDGTTQKLDDNDECCGPHSSDVPVADPLV